MRLALALLVSLSGCIFFSDEDGPSDDVGPYCGDGLANVGNEQCDDGNRLDGDGCSMTCQLETPLGDAFITASWQLKNIATNVTTPCPTGFDTAAVYNQPVDANGNNAGSVIIDLYDCSTGTGTTAPLPPRVYKTWVEITNNNNTSVYARSLSAFIDITVSDKSINVQILNDGGYFHLAWVLMGATSGTSLTCAQAGALGVESVGTDVSNSTNSASDIFDCNDASGFTAGFLAATYTISVAALDASDQSIGTAPTLTNRVIAPKNAVTDLGTVTIPITGL